MANDALKDFISYIKAQESAGDSSRGYSDEYKTVMTDLAVVLSRVAAAKEAEASADSKFKSLAADLVDSVTSAFGADSEVGRAVTHFFGAAKAKASAVATAVTSDELGDKLGAVVDSVAESARSKASSIASAVTTENPDGILSSIISSVAGKAKSVSPASKVTDADISDVIDSVASSTPSAPKKPPVSDTKAAVGELIKTLGGTSSVDSTLKTAASSSTRTQADTPTDSSGSLTSVATEFMRLFGGGSDSTSKTDTSRKPEPARPTPHRPAIARPASSSSSDHRPTPTRPTPLTPPPHKPVSEKPQTTSTASSTAEALSGILSSLSNSDAGTTRTPAVSKTKPDTSTDSSSSSAMTESSYRSALSKALDSISSASPTFSGSGRSAVTTSGKKDSKPSPSRPSAPARPKTVPNPPTREITSEEKRVQEISKLISGCYGICFAHDYSQDKPTVISAGDNGVWASLVNWSDVVEITSGRYFTVAVKANGVLYVEARDSTSCVKGGEIYSWTGIKSLAAGENHLVALKSDGTVIAAGDNSFGQCNVSDFTGVRAIAASKTHTAVLKDNGTVRAVGNESSGCCETIYWEDISAVSAGDGFTVGLRGDGTAICTKSGGKDRYDLSEYRDITAISAGNNHVVMLHKDGKVSAVGENKDACAVIKWENIIAVSAGDSFTMALTADGRVLIAGTLPGSTSGWNIFQNESDLESILSKRESLVSASFSRTNQRVLLISRKTMEIEELSVERAQLGLFDGSAKKRIDTRIAELKKEIAELGG